MPPEILAWLQGISSHPLSPLQQCCNYCWPCLCHLPSEKPCDKGLLCPTVLSTSQVGFIWVLLTKHRRW